MINPITAEVGSLKCPYCTSPSFVYTDGDVKMFLCYGCQRNQNYSKVQSYVFNNNTSNSLSSSVITIKPAINFGILLSTCTVLSDLDNSHPAVKFASARKFPSWCFDDIYYCEDAGDIFRGAGFDKKGPRPGQWLVLPLRTEDDKLFGVQLRSLDGNGLRYQTLIFDKDENKLFGMNRINHDETIHVVEGPIDSLFIKNCLAMAGSSAKLDKYLDPVVILDNEPRNIQIVNKLRKFIDLKFRVVIWPDSVRDKDINDMVLSGLDPQKIINNSIYGGMEAIIAFNDWKKC